MNVADFLRAVVQFDMEGASNPVIVRMDFQLTATSEPFVLTDEGDDIVLALIARYFIPLENYLSNNVTMTQVDLRAFAHPTDGHTSIGSLWQGNNATAMLPPFVALSFRLARNNFAMRNGRKAFPGPCVDAVGLDGDVSGTAKASLALVTAVWDDTPMLVEGVSTDMTFEERIIREPTVDGVNPTIWSTLTWGTAYFGSQNSRK